MSRRFRLVLFLAAAAGLGALLLWGVAGIPGFGGYRHAYGLTLNQAAPKERQTSNVVAAVVFDYRGFDTLGEEFILFASVIGVALLLREPREAATPTPADPVVGNAVRAGGIALVGAVLLLGLYVVAHGYISPGGGFQGGVVLAAAFLLVWLAGSFGAYKRLTPTRAIDVVEGVGAGSYVVIGLVALLLGHAFLHNLLPNGLSGKLSSGGSIPLLNWASGLEVAAAFVLLFTTFLDERALVLSRR